MRAALPSISLFLAACSPTLDPTASALLPAVARDLADKPDNQTVMAMLPEETVVRRGPELVVLTGNRTFRYIDAGECEGFDTCKRTRVHGLYQGRFLGLEFSHGEMPGSYYLIDIKGGRKEIDVEGPPVVARTRPIAAVANYSEVNEPMYPGIAVIDMRNGKTLFREDRLFWATISGWVNDGCLAFTDSNDAAEEGLRQAGWIVERKGKWTLFRERPEPCEKPEHGG